MQTVTNNTLAFDTPIANKLCMARESKGESVAVAVRKPVHARFSQVCKGEGVGRSLNDAATRLIEWFCDDAKCPPAMRAMITAQVPRGMEHAYIQAAEELIGELEDQIPYEHLRRRDSAAVNRHKGPEVRERSAKPPTRPHAPKPPREPGAAPEGQSK
jgi:hypothetical protein